MSKHLTRLHARDTRSPRVRLVVGGASKSGTTAMYYYLKQHPQVCVPRRKELHFFSRKQLAAQVAGPGDRSVVAELPSAFSDYLEFFSHCPEAQIGADISPSYLFHHQSAALIAKSLADPRLVFVLRNPADKAFSQYVHLLSSGRESLSFDQALQEEAQRKRSGYADIWLYRESGFYAESLREFLRVLGAERVRIYYFEEFVSDPNHVLADICSLCGVAADFPFTPVAEVNPTGTPRSRLISRLIAPNALSSLLKRALPSGLAQELKRRVKAANSAGKPRLDEALQAELIAGYRSDIAEVERIVGRPSGWL